MGVAINLATGNVTYMSASYDPMAVRMIDVSRYQCTFDNNGNIVKYMNFRKAASEGIIATAIRCTVGDYYTDPAFHANWLNASGVMLRTPYHVIAPATSPEYGSVPISAEAQMDRFLSVFYGYKEDFPIVLDCELTREQSPEKITNLIKKCIDILTGYGYPVMIYTRAGWWDYNVRRRDYWKDYPLCVANYTSAPAPLIPLDWEDWDIWQFSADGNNQGAKYGSGGEADIDLNRVHYPDFFGELEPPTNGGDMTDYEKFVQDMQDLGVEVTANVVYNVGGYVPPVDPGNGNGGTEPPEPPEPPPPQYPEPIEQRKAQNKGDDDKDFIVAWVEIDSNANDYPILGKAKNSNDNIIRIPNGTIVTVSTKKYRVDGSAGFDRNEARKWYDQNYGMTLYLDIGELKVL